MTLITQIQLRKEERKRKRKKGKQHRQHQQQQQNDDVEEEKPKSKSNKKQKKSIEEKTSQLKKSKEEKGKKNKNKKGKKNKDDKNYDDNDDDPYKHIANPDLIAAIRQDDEEIAALEAKLGIKKNNKKGKEKLNKEYAKLEGFGDDFGDFLDDLDDMTTRLMSSTKSRDDDDDHDDNSDNMKRTKYSYDNDDDDDYDEEFAYEEDSEEENDYIEKQKKKKKKTTTKEDDEFSDPYGEMNPDVAAALRRDDEEIAELEQKLGLSKKKDRDKLHREYAKQEGYGEDFGNFLDDLDHMVSRITDPTMKLSDYKNETIQQYIQHAGSDLDFDDDDDDSEPEELVPMKDPYEDLDEDDSVLDELQEQEEIEKERQRLGKTKDVKSMEEEDDDADDDDDDNDHEESGSDEGSSDKEQEDMEEMDQGDGDDEEEEEFEHEPDHDVADTYKPSRGEDIYGNKIDSGGDDKPKVSKYILPHLRGKKQEGDPSSTGNARDNANGTNKNQNDSQRLIQRSLNNALNRLSEDTLISVSQQLAGLYTSNPTNIVNELIFENMHRACIVPPMIMRGLIPVYVACIVGVHTQSSDTVQLGEYILEETVSEMWKGLEKCRSNDDNEEDEAGSNTEVTTKRVCNLVLILCYLYNFNIVHCSFLYDVIRHMIEKFTEIDIECLLLLLSHCGRALRSDDPLALKDIVLLVQKRKATLQGNDTTTNNNISTTLSSSSSSRSEFMISAIMDLKNNKRNRQDTVVSDRTGKLRKILGRIKSSIIKKSNMVKTSTESSHRISLSDILHVETKGRWWKVGASWVGNQYRFNDDTKNDKTEADKESENENTNKAKENSTDENNKDEALLKLASKYRMNTDRKRSIFCIIMTCNDCDDAFERLCRNTYLQNRHERDTVRVLMECCGNETTYNKFYNHLALRICEFQPQCKFSFQLAYWDIFKLFDSAEEESDHSNKNNAVIEPRKAANLAKLLLHLVTNHVLKVMTVLKGMDMMMSISDMSKPAIIFLTLLLSSILESSDDPMQVKSLFATNLHQQHHHRSSSSKKGRKGRGNDDDDVDDYDDDGEFIDLSGNNSNRQHDQIEQIESIRASLLVFFLETIKQHPKNKKGTSFRKNYKAVIKELDGENGFV